MKIPTPNDLLVKRAIKLNKTILERMSHTGDVRGTDRNVYDMWVKMFSEKWVKAGWDYTYLEEGFGIMITRRAEF